DGVAERTGLLASRILRDRLAVVDELLGRATARLRDELRRVALVVLLQDLEDAARVLQRVVLLRRLAVLEGGAVTAVACLLALRREALLTLTGRTVDDHAGIAPRGRVVLVLLGIPAAEEPVEILGVAVPLVDDHRRVRVALDVVLEVQVVLEDVVDD